ncbi:acyl carrier protein [Lacisediminimonas profundi]|uniref:acyl carrier protein n=1 Tax=Lacisediminimonas profundi TaxID=2603856 RepID=UPI00124B029D|nr:phosphopantetheine-binding protein [Lacisediminimonas profundi]
MDREQLKGVVFETLRGIAPEVQLSQLEPGTPLRDQVDLDSMDWLHFLMGLHQKLHVEIPESDYRQLTTLERLLDYLGKRVA